MIRFLLPIFLLLAAFPLAAQGCYQNLQNGAGVSADPSRASTIACELRESLPEANRASFATYSASLYRFAGNFAPGAAEALVTRLEARAAAASPYYLLIVWEASEDNLFATPHVRVKLPADGPFTCLNPLRRTAWQARLLLQAQGDAPKAKDPEDYLRAETKLMEELSGYVKDLIKCCQQGQTCPDCITRKERIALLKAYPFRTIGQTSYNPAALKYRVDNVEIPGNSTAQIRDGIGISLDLGGGPVNIAEKLKELALEKPELGLNALIVHDSLLCDPELLPGRFFGGSGLRSVGSQVYIILQRDGKVDILGDEVAKEEILETLTEDIKYLTILEAPLVNPCKELTEKGKFYLTPSGKVISILASIIPGYAIGHPHIKDGCLINFLYDGHEYVCLNDENDKYFYGYIRKDFFNKKYEEISKKKIGYQINSKGDTIKVGVNELIDAAKKHKDPDQYYGEGDFIAPDLVTPTVKVNYVNNGALISYKYSVPLGQPFIGPFFTGELERTELKCGTCDKGSGNSFYDDHYQEDATTTEDAYQLCLIAQMINNISKLYFERDIAGKWNDSELRRVYGTLYTILRRNGFSMQDIALEIKKSIEWNNDEYKAKLKSGPEAERISEKELLLLSLASKSDRVISEISIDWRYELVSLIASPKINGGSGLVNYFHGKDFNTGTAEGTLVRLFKHIKNDDAEAFFTLVSQDDDLVIKLFKGFHDYEWLTGDGNYKAFFEAFLALYKKAKKIDLQKLSTDLEGQNKIYHLGDVVYRGVDYRRASDDQGREYWGYFDKYCKSIPKVTRDDDGDAKISDKLTFSASIEAPIDWNGLDCTTTSIPLPSLNLFEPVGIIISKKEGDKIVRSKIQVMPAFALLYYSDVAKQNVQNAEANLAVAGAALVIGVLTLPESSGTAAAIAVLDIIGSVGEVAFAAEDLNNPNAWENSGDASTFRTNWRIATGLVAFASLPSLLKNAPDMVRSLVTGLSKLKDNTAAAIAAVPARARNLIANLEAHFKTSKGASALSGLAAKFAQFGVDANKAEDLAKEIRSHINVHGSNGVTTESEMSDFFIKIYAGLKAEEHEGARKLLIATFFKDKLKFKAFNEDLKDVDFFALMDGKILEDLLPAYNFAFKFPALRKKTDVLLRLNLIYGKVLGKITNVTEDFVGNSIVHLDLGGHNRYPGALKIAWDSEDYSGNPIKNLINLPPDFANPNGGYIPYLDNFNNSTIDLITVESAKINEYLYAQVNRVLKKEGKFIIETPVDLGTNQHQIIAAQIGGRIDNTTTISREGAVHYVVTFIKN